MAWIRWQRAKIADLVGKGARVLVRRALSVQGIDDDRVQATVFDDYVREYAERVGRDGREISRSR